MKIKFLLFLSFIVTNCYSSEESKDDLLEKKIEECQTKISGVMNIENELRPDGIIFRQEQLNKIQTALKKLQDSVTLTANLTKQVLFLHNIAKEQAIEFKELPLITVITDAICLNLPEGSNELDLFICEAKKITPISNRSELKEYLINKNHNLNKLMIWFISTVNTQQALNYEPNRFLNSLFRAIQENKDLEGIENYKVFITKTSDLEIIFKLMIILDKKGNNISDAEFINIFMKDPNNNDPDYQDSLLRSFIKKCKQHKFAGKYLFNSMLKTIYGFKKIKPMLVEMGFIC